MSHVDNVIVTFSISEIVPAIVAHLNQTECLKFKDAWSEPHTQMRWVAGTKASERPLLYSALNYLDRVDLAGAMQSYAWECPDEAQVLICGQHEGLFSFFDWKRYNGKHSDGCVGCECEKCGTCSDDASIKPACEHSAPR